MAPYYDALPPAFKPVHYHVAVGNIDLTNNTFAGEVTIELDTQNSSRQIHLHYRELTLHHKRISVSSASKPVLVSGIHEHNAKEYFVIELAEEIPASQSVTIDIGYQGIIQTNMAGFYRSAYEKNGVQKHMVSTQFEATDARRTFPCMDEPALKATFSVQLTIDKNLVALSNTPVSIEDVQGDVKTVVFEKTPLMSTYLLAWAVGEFEYIETFTEHHYHDNKPLPIRIYTTKDLEDAQFALEITPKIVDYFSTIFELKYPLPKLDLLAVHSFSHNAMENWGLITYRATALLYSEEKSDPAYKKNVAYVVAHEIAHQWFGDLVTMQWWDELWLNEGFATWVGFTAVDYLFPEWDIFSSFVSESLQVALDLDSLPSSHPIHVPVKDALEIDELFDYISYLKGGSAIRMLSSYLGLETFLKGVARYLNKHKFGNATTADLWQAINDVSGRPVSEIMENWIKKIGFPVLLVTSDTKLEVRQSRFLKNGDVKPEDDEVVWKLPLTYTMGDEVHTVLMDSKTWSIPEPLGYFKLNSDTQGIYRVNYSPELLQKHIYPHFDRLSIKDRIGLIADVASLAVAGNTPTTSLLDLISSVDLEEDFVVWKELGLRLAELRTVFPSEELTKFLRKVYEPIAMKLADELSDDYLRKSLRAEVLYQAGVLGVSEITKLAYESFARWKNGETIEPALKKFVFSTIATSPFFSEGDFAAIFSEVTNPTSINSREVALSALGHVQNPAVTAKLLKHLMEPEVIPVMDSHFFAIPLSYNTTAQDALWEVFSSNYDTFHKLMSTNMVVLDRFVKLTLKNYTTEEKHDKIKAFFDEKDTHGFERSLNQALDSIKNNAAWKTRDAANVGQWLANQ